MTLPLPQPGQVIRYAYLWWNEARAGSTDGIKNRPCSIVLTSNVSGGHTIVYVLPITHTPPANADEDGVEVPRATKHRLGLDAARSWIITTELNQFTWPGPDLRLTATGDYLYGFLPERLMRMVLKSVKKNARGKRLKAVPRTD